MKGKLTVCVNRLCSLEWIVAFNDTSLVMLILNVLGTVTERHPEAGGCIKLNVIDEKQEINSSCFLIEDSCNHVVF